MSDKRISQLVERVTLANNDVFPIVASGAATTNKVTLQTIDDYMQTNLDFGVTSVAMSVPTGLSVTGTPITSTGTFVVTFTAGYSIPTNAKQTQWDTAYTNRITSATAPLGIASNVISITQSGAASNGYLSSTDWNIFNNKQATITTGNLTESTSSVLTITGGTSSVLGSGTTIQVTQASGSQDGFLDSADWTTFNGKQNALSGTGIVKSTGGTISYLTDSTSNWDSAYNDKINSAAVTGTTTKTLTLTQQDGGTITANWTDLDTGTVTSVGVSMPSAFSVVGSPITSSGTITITGSGLVSQYIDGTGALQTFPSGLPPTGAAGGDLTGTYPNPTVHKVHGIDLQSGTPTADDVWVYGGSPAKWQHQKLHSNQVTEDGNLFYTDARARAAFSESVTGLDYNSTTGVLSTATGYSIPSTASQTNWTAAYDDTILSAAVTGTTTKTLTLTQRDSGTITASWTDINTDAVTSVFGRTGAVVATSGDYNTDQVTEGTTNLYFTNTRARSSISLTTTGTSGASTYVSGVLNVPTYTLAGLGGQPALNGTGFVKATGTTITYDNTSYLPLGGGVMSGNIQYSANGGGTNFYIESSDCHNGPWIRFRANTAAAGYSNRSGALGFIDGLCNRTTVLEWDDSRMDIYVSTLYTVNIASTGVLSSSVSSGYNFQAITPDGANAYGLFGYSFYVSTNSHEIARIAGNYESSGSSGRGGLFFKTRNDGTLATRFTINGDGTSIFTNSVTASSFIKSGGTSSQFLKADGSVDSSTYLTTGTAGTTYVPYTGANANVNLGANGLQAGGVITTGRTTSDAGGAFVMNIGNGTNYTGGVNSVTMYAPTTSQLMFVYKDASVIKLVSLSPSQPDNSQRYFSWPSSDGQLALVGQIPTNNNQLTNGAGYITSAALTGYLTDTNYSYQVLKTLSLTAGWIETGINSSALGEGTYLIRVYVDNYASGGGQYSTSYVGIMYWRGNGTNSDNVCEIPLHHAGHSDGGSSIYLRTKTTYNADGKTYLQIRGQGSYSASNYNFYFKRLM